MECRAFNHQFSRLFTGNTPFKVHNIDHYPEATEEFGCLFYYSTIRYERVHQLIKRFVQSSNNNTSLPQQICYKWVVVNLINLNQKATVEKSDDIYEIYESSDYGNDVPDNFARFIDRDRNCTALNSFNLNGSLIKINEIYLYKRYSISSNPFPIFVRILGILKQDDSVKIVGKHIFCIKYHERVQAFEVIEREEISLVDRIEWHKSINVISANGSYLIIQNFYVPYEHLLKYSKRIEFTDDDYQSHQIDLENNQPSTFSDNESDLEC